MSEKREKPHWEGKHYSFFQNTECEYFPCHRIADPTRFNCLFCYCPLYMLGPDCGGNYRYTQKGIKDCTGCLIPHLPENYGRITGNYTQIAAAMRKNSGIPEESAKKTGDEDVFLSCSRIVMMACTERGFATMRRAADALAELVPGAEILQTGRCAHVPGYEDGPRLSELTAKWFYEADALVFFAAAGIAVRCIAPFAADKFRDPAVLVLDEKGKFVISLMSGHAGGANRLSLALANALGAQPVITTATDGRGLFAVDVFAVENGLQISDRTIAKEISSRILAGDVPGLFLEEDDKDVWEELRKYGQGIRRTLDRSQADIIISCRRLPGDRENALYLIPSAVTLGIGCKRGTTEEAIQKAVQETLQNAGVFRQALCGITSIDLKKDEEGLLAFARKQGLPITFYRAEELNTVTGIFSTSEFVRGVTGVDCVCEQSAVRLAAELAEKRYKDRASAAAAQKQDKAHLASSKEKSADALAFEPEKHTACEDTAEESSTFLLEKKQSLNGVTTALAVYR